MLWALPLLLLLSSLLLYYQTNHSLWSMRLLPVLLYLCHPLILIRLYEYGLQFFLIYSSSLSVYTPSSLSSIRTEPHDTTGPTDDSYHTSIKPLTENILLILIMGVVQYGYLGTGLVLILMFSSLSLFQGSSLFLCLIACCIFRRYRKESSTYQSFTDTVASYALSKGYISTFTYALIIVRSILTVCAILYYAPSLLTTKADGYTPLASPPLSSTMDGSTDSGIATTDSTATIVLQVPFYVKEYVRNYLYHQFTLYEFNVHTNEPEMSPLWYLFNEIFLRSMPYFTIIIYAQVFLYAIPIGMRLFFFPSGALLCTIAFTSMFDPTINYTLLRLPVILSLMLTSPTLIHEMKNTTLWFGMHYFSYIASFFMKNLWLSNGNIRGGNANFMFNQHLIFNLCNGALIAEFTASILRLYRQLRKPKKD